MDQISTEKKDKYAAQKRYCKKTKYASQKLYCKKNKLKINERESVARKLGRKLYRLKQMKKTTRRVEMKKLLDSVSLPLDN